MLNEIRIINFKSFKDSETIDLKPITVLCGTNSSGKSSILKSVLSLKQSWESDRSLNSLSLNGKYSKNGRFKDIVHKKNEENVIFVNKFTINYGEATRKSQSDYYAFSLLNKIYQKAITSKIDKKHSKFEIQYKVEFDSVDNYKEMHFKGHSDSILVSVEVNIVFENKLLKKRKSSIKLQFNGGDNRFGYSLIFDGIPIPMGYENRKYSQVNCFFSGLQLTNITDLSNVDEKTYSALSSILTIFQVISEQYDAISYVGPLREEPKRMYVFDEAVLDVGIKGEMAPMVYFSNNSAMYNMPIYNDKGLLINQNNVFSFQQAVNYWLRYLEINDLEIGQTEEIIRLLLQNGIEGGVNIADVGFGISQTFPIVVEALRISKGSTLFLEQPEIHLHPKMQMKLADFFIAMSKFDRRIVIETHSDHLVNRLVRRIMEDSTSKLKEDIGIYFVTQNDNKSELLPIPIDLVLGVAQWPKDFFDQYATETETIMKVGFENNRRIRVETDRSSDLFKGES